MTRYPRKAETDVNRPEGVYCEWVVSGGVRLLKIERVNGDCSVTTMIIAPSEVDAIAQALREREKRE